MSEEEPKKFIKNMKYNVKITEMSNEGCNLEMEYDSEIYPSSFIEGSFMATEKFAKDIENYLWLISEPERIRERIGFLKEIRKTEQLELDEVSKRLEACNGAQRILSNKYEIDRAKRLISELKEIVDEI